MAEHVGQDIAGRALERVLALIDVRYNHRLDIDALCSEAHFSRFHFIRTFRTRLFETPHQYIVRKRIDKARELLATSDMSVTEICFEDGPCSAWESTKVSNFREALEPRPLYTPAMGRKT
ncbi:MAG: AraC family transcriptional regulator [Spirochaetia bacterium]